MSYARASGEFSDLYIIATTGRNDNIIYQCIGCPLLDKINVKIIKTYPSGYTAEHFYEHPQDYIAHNLPALIRHLRHHLFAGHKIPYGTWIRVLGEYFDVFWDRDEDVVSDKYMKLFPKEAWEFEENWDEENAN